MLMRASGLPANILRAMVHIKRGGAVSTDEQFRLR
jgi:hypothetical protein